MDATGAVAIFGTAIAVITAVYTGWGLLQKADSSQISNMLALISALQAQQKIDGEHIAGLEEQLSTAGLERTRLMGELAQVSQLLLSTQLLMTQGTSAIRDDIRKNTAISEDAFHEANAAKAAIAEALRQVAAASTVTNARMSDTNDTGHRP